MSRKTRGENLKKKPLEKEERPGESRENKKKSQGKKKREPGQEPRKKDRTRGGRRETEPGKFWSLNQQQILMLLPPLSSS